MQLQHCLRLSRLKALGLEISSLQAIGLHGGQITYAITIVHGGKVLTTQLTHPGFAASEHRSEPRALFLGVDDHLVGVPQRHPLFSQDPSDLKRTHHPHNAIESTSRRDSVDV